MRYLLRLILYVVIFWVTCSLSLVLLLRFVPVTVTPLKVIRLVENFPTDAVRISSRWISLDRISPLMIRAVIATEDNNFMIHRGFDWDAIEKARTDNLQGKKLRGGSTIPQQTAKNVFCTPGRTWFRKGVEAYYTVLIEALWGKKRIMEVYLNVIETGQNRFGVEAPAREVYQKPAAELNLYEAAMIATVLPNPLRMQLEHPSNYMVRRAAQVRSLIYKVPPVDFDRPAPDATKR